MTPVFRDSGDATPPPVASPPPRKSTAPEPPQPSRARGLATYFFLGVAFGVVLIKSEVVSWFRIQEMFRFQAFHMYGIIGSAILTAAIALQLIKRLGMRSLSGEPIVVPAKTLGTGTRYWLGGTIFGLGWPVIGACPGPIFALVGSGLTVMLVTLASAIAGTWAYGALRPHLPH